MSLLPVEGEETMFKRDSSLDYANLSEVHAQRLATGGGRTLTATFVVFVR